MVTHGKAEEGDPAAVGQEGKPALARPPSTESLSTPFPSSGPRSLPPWAPASLLPAPPAPRCEMAKPQRGMRPGLLAFINSCCGPCPGLALLQRQVAVLGPLTLLCPALGLPDDEKLSLGNSTPAYPSLTGSEKMLSQVKMFMGVGGEETMQSRPRVHPQRPQELHRPPGTSSGVQSALPLIGCMILGKSFTFFCLSFSI